MSDTKCNVNAPSKEKITKFSDSENLSYDDVAYLSA